MMRATHIASETLSAYVDGELSREEHARVVSHLQTCEACRGRLHDLQFTVEMVRDLDPLLAPEELRETVAGRLADARAPR
ncbi:MAG TPA: zf-HC2 domain-containing protein, partial [bacterium]